MATRRWFLRTSGLTLAALGTAPGWLLSGVAQGRRRPKVLVTIFQRGAADGLSLVVPFFEKRYYQLRPRISVSPPTRTATGRYPAGIDLDGRFALHPQLQELKPLWDQGQLAIVHAAGSPDASRSHFDAQAFMESGTPGAKMADGWLNRALPITSATATPLRAVAVGDQLPWTLRGDRSSVAMDDLQQFDIGNREAARLTQRLYARSADARLRTLGAGTFDALKKIDALRQQPYAPANGARYLGEFGRRLQQLARLIKGDVGVEAAFVDIDGWDHHVNAPVFMSSLLYEFGTSLAAFTRDLGDHLADVVIVTMSEFGRTVAENGGAGTDHGHGGVMLVMGEPVRGGAVYGEWPGLAPEQLFEKRDLAVTTDFRDVLGELVRGHLGQSTEKVFPGFAGAKPLGLLARV